jgi:hypothetical protein
MVDGWIAAEGMSLDEVHKQIISHSKIADAVLPIEVEVTLSPHPAGFVAVCFPSGLPAYDLVNLLSWLNEGNRGAIAFLKSPNYNARYCITIDGDNPAGDIALAAADDDSALQISLPDMIVTTASSGNPSPEPDPSLEPVTRRLVVGMDGNPNFGNPSFDVTYPKRRIHPELQQLIANPSASAGTLHTPDTAQMGLSTRAVESQYGGELLFSATEWHDTWLLLQADGSWHQVQQSDGCNATYPSSLHLCASLLIRAYEEGLQGEALIELAKAFGLPKPESVHVVLNEPRDQMDYDAYHSRIVARLIAL